MHITDTELALPTFTIGVGELLEYGGRIVLQIIFSAGRRAVSLLVPHAVVVVQTRSQYAFRHCDAGRAAHQPLLAIDN